MIREVVQSLDRWVASENAERAEEGALRLRPSRIRLFGQMALLERQVPLALVATRDVDVLADYEFPVEREFRRLLAEQQLDLDPVGHEAWMPVETEYQSVFHGSFVSLEIADTDGSCSRKQSRLRRRIALC
jgi:hypothetical protein